jgi:uncharacterized membrane protein YgdD (TMEM256/DUF423 family)
MRILLIKIASLSMLFAVVLGAMGAHWLKQKITFEQLQSFHTGVEYQIYHSLALLFLSIIPVNMLNEKVINKIFFVFILGIVLFSGSIYLLAIRNIIHLESSVKILGPITPIGGLCFITGWILLFSSIKNPK